MSVQNIDDFLTIVTGASSGLGEATAHKLALEGRRVMTLQRRPPENLMRENYRHPIEFMEVDLYDHVAIDQVTQLINQKYQVGYLVNNAGVNRPGSIEAVTEIKANGQFDLIVANIFARVHISLAAEFYKALRNTSTHSGTLITAGYTSDREEAVTSAMIEVGFAVCDRVQIDEWIAIAYHTF